MKRSVWALAALIAIISLGVVKFCLVQDLSALCGGGGRIVVEQMVWHQTVAAPGETIVLEEEQQTAIAAALEQVKWRRANWSSKSDREPRIDVHFSIVQANGSECRGHVLYCYGDGTVRMPDGWMHVGRWGRKHGRELYAQLSTIVAERDHALSAEKCSVECNSRVSRNVFKIAGRISGDSEDCRKGLRQSFALTRFQIKRRFGRKNGKSMV